MRRGNREIKAFKDIISIMEKCDVCRLALHDKEYPYILPLNFGMKVAGNKVTLYFHGAYKGKKYDLLDINNKVGFEMDCSHRLITDMDDGNCTMEFESVIGQGEITMVPDDEKLEALEILMEHYPAHKDFNFNKSIIPVTRVMKLEISSFTGKRRMT